MVGMVIATRVDDTRTGLLHCRNWKRLIYINLFVRFVITHNFHRQLAWCSQPATQPMHMLIRAPHTRAPLHDRTISTQSPHTIISTYIIIIFMLIGFVVDTTVASAARNGSITIICHCLFRCETAIFVMIIVTGQRTRKPALGHQWAERGERAWWEWDLEKRRNKKI